MNNNPHPGDLWLVSTNKDYKTISRVMLIVSESEEQAMVETLMCTTDLNLSSDKTLLLNPENTALQFSIGIHLDIFSILLADDVSFNRRLGKISEKTFTQILEIINNSNSNMLQNFQVGEKIIYRSDRRWLNKKNEIALSDLFSNNALSLIFDNFDENWVQLFELENQLKIESTDFWDKMIEDPIGFDLGNLLSSRNLNILSMSEKLKYKDNYLYIDYELLVS